MVFPPILPLVLPHETYLHEAVPPRCFNHLCLFHFSAPFFSAFPIIRRGFHLTPYPLICNPGISPDVTYRLSLQSLTPPKQA